MTPEQPGELRRSDWIRQCTEQVRRADPSLNDDEAADVALQLFSFERTVAMPPEEAVNFVVTQLAAGAPRFERRSPGRLVTIRAKR